MKKYMRKLITYFSLTTLLFGSFILPVAAQTTATSAKADVVACMKTATAKKNAAVKSAREVYLMALKQAKGKEGRTVRAKAREAEKQAQKAAKEAFTADRKACAALAPKKEKGEVKVELAAQNNSDISGVALLKEKNNKVEIKINLKGVTVNASEPAHIHTGTCASLGGIKYPLVSPIGGKSETKLDVSLAQLKAELPLSINVHKSAEEPGVYVACGDIKL